MILALTGLLSLGAAAQSQSQTVPASVSALSPDAGRYRVENSITVPVPEGAKDLRLWFPLPRLDPEQEISELAVEAPDGWKETKDALGSRFVYLQVAEPKGKVSVVTRFVVTRHEVNAAVDPAFEKLRVLARAAAILRRGS